MARKIDPLKRDSILESARQLFKTRGVEKTTMAEIASAAGIATGTVYLYFESKSAIIDALCNWYLLDNVKAVTPAYENKDPYVAIKDALHASLEHASANADLIRLIDMRRSILGKKGRLPADRVIQKTLQASLARYMDDGSVITYNTVILAELITGLHEWISKVCFVWSDVDPRRYEDTLVEMLRHALLKNYRGKKQ